MSGMTYNVDYISICVNGKIERYVKERTGHWIDTGSGQECSVCREIQYGYDTGRHFCSNCGARMVSEE